MKRLPLTRQGDAWAICWRSDSALDGDVQYLVGEVSPGHTLLFMTRDDARQHIKARYGYINTRPDLKAEPHGWRMPRAVPVSVMITEKRKS